MLKEKFLDLPPRLLPAIPGLENPCIWMICTFKRLIVPGSGIKAYG